MRQKAIVAVGPQVRVEGLKTLLQRPLHHNFPSAFKRFLQQGWKYSFQLLALEVVKEDFCHPVRVSVERASRWLNFLILRRHVKLCTALCRYRHFRRRDRSLAHWCAARTSFAAEKPWRIARHRAESLLIIICH